MVRVVTRDEKFMDFLTKHGLSFEETDQNEILFHSTEQFAGIFSTYYFITVIDDTLDAFEKDRIIDQSHRDQILFLLDPQSVKELEEKIKIDTYAALDAVTDTVYRVDFEEFPKRHLENHRKHIINLLYRCVFDYFKDTNRLDLNRDLPERKEIVYLTIEENGTLSIRDKDTTLLLSFSYQQQVDAIAHTIYLNAQTTIVYDPLNLLDQEMAICLKRYLQKKVIFLEEAFPIRSN